MYEILPAKNSRVQAQLVQKASFPKMAGLRLKVYVISDANTRKSDRGTFFNTIAYEENGKTIKTVQYPEKFRLQKENFYLLINVSVVEDTVRLNDTSRVSNYISINLNKYIQRDNTITFYYVYEMHVQILKKKKNLRKREIGSDKILHYNHATYT